MPIHRLDEEPTRRGVLADLTCDSDGMIDHFIDRRDVKHVLELHPLDGEPYYLGMFLIGAYQEILGDLHNLFGDTNAVHVALGENDRVEIEHVVEGDSVDGGARLRAVQQGRAGRARAPCDRGRAAREADHRRGVRRASAAATSRA